MVLSTPAALLGGLACLSQFGAALAATVTYNWNITWVRANPDGAFERPVMGINGQWPLPVVNLTKGDRLVANVRNQLGNQTTSMHWHGLFQNGTNFMDGPQGVTQCGIAPGSSMTYNFTVNHNPDILVSYDADCLRSSNLGPTGIIRTHMGSIPMDYDKYCMSTIRRILTKTNLMKKSR